MKGTNRRLRLCSDCGGRGVKVKFVVEKEKSWEHRLENGCSFFELENVQEFLRCFGQRPLGIVGDDEGSAREFFLDVQGEEFAIVGYAVVRDKGDAETDAGKINQEVVTAQFDFRDQIQLVLLEEVVQEFAGGAFPVEHHDRVVQEIFQVQFFIHQFFVVG